MKFWTDNDGNKLTFRQFITRWKEGVEGTTPLQQTIIQIYSTVIIITGLLIGIVITLIGFKTLWWVTIILVGALGNTSVQLLGLVQKKKAYKLQDLIFHEALVIKKEVEKNE